MDVQLGHQRGSVIVYGLGANAQLGPNLGIRQSARHEVHDLTFAGGQRRARRAVFQQRDHIGRNKLRALYDHVQTPSEQRRVALFQKHAIDTGGQQITEQTRRTETSVNSDPGAWALLADLKEYLRPMRFGHGDIEHHKIWLVGLGGLNSVRSGRRLAHDLETQISDDFGDRSADNRVIVCDDGRLEL